MAPSCRHFPFLFILALFFFLHAHARDTQFFSKLTNKNNNYNNNNNAQESIVQVPNKSEPQSLSQNVPEPNFIPDDQNGYGLYGHESGQLPPSATTATPYTAATNHHTYKTQPGGPYRVYTTTNSDNNHNRHYYSKDSFVTSDSQPQGISDNRFMHRVYATRPNNNNYYQGGGLGGAAATNTRNYYSGGGGGGDGNGYNPQQEGMSDTRFLENGRYFYDVKNEDNYGREYGNSRWFEYNKRNYGNNENSYEYDQNQEEFEDGSQEEYEP